MKAIGYLATSRTINGRELYIDVYEYKTVYHVYMRWDGERDYVINGHKVTKRIETKEAAIDVILNDDWTKRKLSI